jgi:hypothetical protein
VKSHLLTVTCCVAVAPTVSDNPPPFPAVRVIVENVESETDSEEDSAQHTTAASSRSRFPNVELETDTRSSDDVKISPVPALTLFTPSRVIDISVADPFVARKTANSSNVIAAVTAKSSIVSSPPTTDTSEKLTLSGVPSAIAPHDEIISIPAVHSSSTVWSPPRFVGSLNWKSRNSVVVFDVNNEVSVPATEFTFITVAAVFPLIENP